MADVSTHASTEGVSVVPITAADIALLDRTIAILRSADLMTERVGALRELRDRMARG